MKDVKTTPLLRWEERLEAMRGHRAQAIGHWAARLLGVKGRVLDPGPLPLLLVFGKRPEA